MANLFGKTAAEVLQERRINRQQLIGNTIQNNMSAARTPDQFAGVGIGSFLGALGAKYFGGDDTNDPAVQAANAQAQATQQVQALMEEANNNPEIAEQRLMQAAQIANQFDTKTGIALAEQAVAARDKYAPIQAQQSFTATETAVASEVDPVADPVQYTKLMAERLGASANPLVQAKAKEYQDRLVEFGVAAAKARADQENVAYDAPESNEVSSARSLISASPVATNKIGELDEEDITAASVELASRAKDIQARENIPYLKAQAKAWQEMQTDGTITIEEGGLWGLLPDNYKYATKLAPPSAPKEINGKKVTIKVKD